MLLNLQLFIDGLQHQNSLMQVGMAATLASVCSVPLTSVLLLFELTKDYTILLPLLVSFE